MYFLSFVGFSRAQHLAEEEALSKEAFFDRCAHNPHLRDRLPILTRNLNMQRKVDTTDWIRLREIFNLIKPLLCSNMLIMKSFSTWTQHSPLIQWYV